MGVYIKGMEKKPCKECLFRGYEYCLLSEEYIGIDAEYEPNNCPLIEVKAPRGEWIEQEDDYYHYWECSECGMGVGFDDIRNYCPNCGAHMKGADDEHDK